MLRLHALPALIARLKKRAAIRVMTKRRVAPTIAVVTITGALVCVLFIGLPHWRSRAQEQPASAKSDAAKRQQVSEQFGQLPLSFEANQGQTDIAVKFMAQAPGYQLFLTDDEAVMVLRKPAPKSQTPSINVCALTHDGSRAN